MLKLDINLLWTVVNVLVMYAVLRKFLFKPVQDVIAKRQQMVDANLADAETSKKEAAETMNAAQEKLRNVDNEAAARREAYEKQAEVEKQQLLAEYKPVVGKRGSIGIPLCLGFYELLPFWWAFWTKLGFAVHTSPVSSRGLYLAGQATIPSDTACFPAKLSHGHIKALSQMHLDAIFYPCLTYNFDEGLGDNHYNCPVVAYYPEVLACLLYTSPSPRD